VVVEGPHPDGLDEAAVEELADEAEGHDVLRPHGVKDVADAAARRGDGGEDVPLVGADLDLGAGGGGREVDEAVERDAADEVVPLRHLGFDLGQDGRDRTATGGGGASPPGKKENQPSVTRARSKTAWVRVEASPARKPVSSPSSSQRWPSTPGAVMASRPETSEAAARVRTSGRAKAPSEPTRTASASWPAADVCVMDPPRPDRARV